MTWLQIFFAFIKITRAILRYLERKRLLEREKALAIQASLEAANELVAEAIAARKSVVHDPDSVRDDARNRDRELEQKPD